MEMETIEERFFREYDIKPLIKKGEKYITSECRFAEVIAAKDIYPIINGDKLIELELLLNSFTLKVSVGPYDDFLYRYISGNRTTEDEYFSRKEALLAFFLTYPDYKPYVKTMLEVK